MTNQEIFAQRQQAEHERKVQLASAWLHKVYQRTEDTEGALLMMTAVKAVVA